MAPLVKCPTCRREVEWSQASPYRPFCSDRCRLIDMGGWLSEKHKIPDDPGASEDHLTPDAAEDP